MIKQQETMILSVYTGIYDLVIPKDNLLRKINEFINFLDMLINKTVTIALGKGILKSII